jgi:predicted nucleotidyltransferase
MQKPGQTSGSSDLTSRLACYFASRNAPGVLLAYLYGSHGEGRAHRQSDVDVAVLLDRERFPTAAARFDERVRLTAELIAVLHNNEIDLVVLNDVSPLLGRRVVYEGRRLFCADSGAEHAFVRDVQLRAADLEPWLRRMRRRQVEVLSR